MINYNVSGVCLIIRALDREEERSARLAGAAMTGNEDNPKRFYVSDEDKTRLDGILIYVRACADQLQSQAVHDRLELFSSKMRFEDLSHQVCVAEIRALRESLEAAIRFVRLYKYPREKAELLIKLQVEWAATIKAFLSAQPEIEHGVDCYACGHDTAAVFHMMRVSEIGMRVLARERKVALKHPLEWSEWGDIIEEIERSFRGATQGMPRGLKLDAMRSFYIPAIAQLRAFKETRNKISHMRGQFDELDAQRTIQQVRDFMNGLSSKIGEKTRGPIRKWP
jgi:hypothetical protein